MAVLLPLVLAGGALLLLGSKRNVSAPPSAGAQNSSGYPGLSAGDMQVIQYDLAWIGYYRGPLHGQYDAATKDAIISFQDDHGLIPDGAPGRDTWELLDQMSAAAP